MNRRWIGPVVIALMVAFALAVYGRLPEQVPTHFDLSGEPDDWMDRLPGAFLLPAIAAGVYLLLFVGLGNYLPRIRSNWWIGIRTPWTLESEAVWRETHRLAGWTFVGAGLRRADAQRASRIPTMSVRGRPGRAPAGRRATT